MREREGGNYRDQEKERERNIKDRLRENRIE